VTDTTHITFRDDLRRGELYWLDWSPRRGSEQTGKRPALIISTDASNSNPRYGLVITVTVSTKGKAHIPTHVELQPTPENGLRETSFAKAEQILTADKDRILGRIGQITEAEMRRVEIALKKAQGMR
jgi:mRNA interferase MazF